MIGALPGINYKKSARTSGFSISNQLPLLQPVQILEQADQRDQNQQQHAAGE